MKKTCVILLVLLSGCDGGTGSNPMSMNDIPRAFASNGERIYFTGVSASGKPIRARGGDAAMGMHMQMHGGGCATCHGDDREGRRLMPRFWIKAPALTAEALFGDDDHKKDSDGHGNHGNYDAVSLRLAIIEGVDPAGEPLDQAMPRWSMNESDLNDLIAYLQNSPDH
jgi:mono/diheme cytochrome c family protein